MFLGRFIAVALLVCLTFSGRADPVWKLRKSEDGINIYTAPSDSSNFKAIKVEFNLHAGIHQFIAFLLDVPRQSEWVYNTRKAQILKQVAPNEVIFYSEVSLPWPCSDRDYIAHFVISHISDSLTIINSHVEQDYQPIRKGFVRVKQSLAHWEISSLSASELKIVYTLRFDPGGALPAWLVNLFIAKGPSSTFQKLRILVDEPQYHKAHLHFLD